MESGSHAKGKCQGSDGGQATPLSKGLHVHSTEETAYLPVIQPPMYCIA